MTAAAEPPLPRCSPLARWRPRWRRARTDRLIRRADGARDAGDYAAAAALYRRALAISPERPGIRVQLAHMLKELTQFGEAEATYRQALVMQPDDSDLHLQLGHLLKLLGRPEEAIALYAAAQRLAPQSADVAAELRALAAARGNADVAPAPSDIAALLAMTGELADRVARLTDALPDLYAPLTFPVDAYDRFRRLFDVPAPPRANEQCRFAIVAVAPELPLDRLYAQLAAVAEQHHQNWQLAVIGCDIAQRRAVERAAVSDPRVSWIEAAAGEAPGDAEPRAAAALAAEWLILPAPGALLHRHALGWFAAIVGEGTARAFVTDEECVADDGGAERRSAPRFRQVVDYDTLLEANPFGETVIVARDAYLGVASELVGAPTAAARASLLLALAARGTVGHIPLPLVARAAGGQGDDDAAVLAHQAAVSAHLAARGLADRIDVAPPAAGHPVLRIAWRPREEQHPLQVVIPTRDNAGDVRALIDSLHNHAAAPDAVRFLVVDNGSRLEDTARILAELGARRRVETVVIDEPFNWARLNNRAVAMTSAEFLVFANDDMVVLSDGWDRQVRGLLERPEIGAVGARLLYPDDRVQHAGMLFDWQGEPIHDGRDQPADRGGPGLRWQLTRAVGSVTGAFVAVRRDVFEACGGFDEKGLAVSYGDVDFAMKLRVRGLKVLWTPRITLRHYESKTRGLDHIDVERAARNTAERAVMQRRWGAAMRIDPGVNPHWHTATPSFDLIRAPSSARLWRHIRLCASDNPWRLDPPAEGAPP